MVNVLEIHVDMSESECARLQAQWRGMLAKADFSNGDTSFKKQLDNRYFKPYAENNRLIVVPAKGGNSR